MELKRKAVIGVCENRWVSETTDNSVKGLLLFFGPTKWRFRLAPEFLCCYFCESSCLFYLSFNFDFYVSKIMHL